jgi:hypothetical protein
MSFSPTAPGPFTPEQIEWLENNLEIDINIEFDSDYYGRGDYIVKTKLILAGKTISEGRGRS